MVLGYPHTDLTLACFQKRDFYWEAAVLHGQDGKKMGLEKHFMVRSS